MRMRRFLRGVIGFAHHLKENDTFSIAASTAFFFLVALFPLLMMISWIFEYANLPLRNLEGFLPTEMIALFAGGEMSGPVWNPLNILLTLWGSSLGVWSLMKGVNKAYTGKALGSIKARLLAIVFTFCFLAVLALTLTFFAVGRWSNLFIMGGVIFLLIFALYSYTPGTSANPLRSLWTAALAAGVWLFASRGFELYMRYFARFNVLYGSLGTFLGLTLWVFVISAVTILGAELGGYNPKSE